MLDHVIVYMVEWPSNSCGDGLNVTVSQQTISEIVQRILSVAAPERIVLFGSAANDTMTEDSDIDLLIVLPQIADRNKEYLRIRRALRDVPYPFDLVLVTSQWFEATKGMIGGIAYPAETEGCVIYDAA